MATGRNSTKMFRPSDTVELSQNPVFSEIFIVLMAFLLFLLTLKRHAEPVQNRSSTCSVRKVIDAQGRPCYK